MASLLQLLFGKPVEQFRAEHWPDRPLCVAGSIDRLAELCASPVFADIASFIASHPGRAWLHRHTPEGFDHETTVDAATAVELYEGGSMMDLQDVHHWLPAAKAWLARLQAELGLEQVAQLEHEGYVHAFVSPAGTGAPSTSTTAR